MFMVASSVVSTILILNYHHRNADTHEMSEWVSEIGRDKVVECLEIRLKQERIDIPVSALKNLDAILRYF